MTHWRMQLHPGGSREGTKSAAESLSAGFIGLDFGEDPGDLTRLPAGELSGGEADYPDLVRMAAGDRVLLMSHHHPFALATIAGDYNYVRTPVPELGVWFRHFRRVRDVHFYFDWRTNPKEWERIVMTDTISVLKDPGSKSYRLIEEWAAAIESF